MSSEEYKNLIIKQLQGEATAQENQALAAWQAASPENKALFDDFVKIWKISPHSEPKNLPDLDREWQQVAEILQFQSKKPAGIVGLRSPVQPAQIPRFQFARVWAVAAVVLFIVTASIVFNRLEKTGSAVQIIAKAGTLERIELPDGSTVRLNSVSNISYESGLPGNDRVVRLAGEAFFQIKKDGRPFIVETENARIRVLGTSFDVWSRENETRVVVEEGRVALEPLHSTKAQGLILTANQMATCDRDKLSGEAIAVNALERLGWLQGKIVFTKTPLSEVVAELQRVYAVRIELSDAWTAQQTLTAAFDKNPVESVLESVCLALHLHLSFDGEIYTITEVR